MKIFLIIILLLTLIGPLYIPLSGAIDFHGDYRTANRDSAKLAPDAVNTKDAVVQVYFARTFSWRGIFAVHTWIAVKAKDASTYHVYQVIGWRLFRNLPPLVTDEDIPDRNWFAQKPTIILDVRGAKAELLIEKINAAIKTYPYAKEYSYWPGPNSNTFTAYVAKQVPEMQLALPSNAVGKDFVHFNDIFGPTASGTGYQFSLYGILGVSIARIEGIEINLFGLVYGFKFNPLTLKLPGFGDLELRRIWQS